MIKFENVSKRYDIGFEALKQVNFVLPKGEIAFLTGHSGAGKSTLLKLIALIERCSYGKVIVDDCDLSQMRARHIPWFRRQLGVIFQSPHLLKDKTVFENVALPLVIAGASKAEIKRRVRAALELVGLSTKDKMIPLRLSGGEQQRVGIARAVVHRPKLLLADEPTGNLDPLLSAEIMQIFTKLNHFGVTVLVATHDLALIANKQAQIFTLNQGRMFA